MICPNFQRIIIKNQYNLFDESRKTLSLQTETTLYILYEEGLITFICPWHNDTHDCQGRNHRALCGRRHLSATKLRAIQHPILRPRRQDHQRCRDLRQGVMWMECHPCAHLCRPQGTHFVEVGRCAGPRLCEETGQARQGCRHETDGRFPLLRLLGRPVLSGHPFALERQHQQRGTCRFGLCVYEELPLRAQGLWCRTRLCAGGQRDKLRHVVAQQ